MEITLILGLIFLVTLSGNLSYYILNKKRNKALSNLESWKRGISSNLSAKVKDLQNKTRKPLGEVYTSSGYTYSNVNTCAGIYIVSSVGSYPSGWKKFYKIDEEFSGCVKIDGQWHERKNVLFYDDIYNKQRKKIEKRMNNK